MIQEIKKGMKGNVILKGSKKGDNIYYVQTVYRKKTVRLLAKNMRDAIKDLGISPTFLPPVYGDIIIYADCKNNLQRMKFRIKGIDKFPHKKSKSYGSNSGHQKFRK